ncbi:hypothetical protein [Pseudomonas panipatensis]|uniref:Uncharacterized protein n=1 Tax=Pseudomonas panipatensis TaxID=428992 RepID=A0A1G8CVB4_9PSED|nr:hypothetical protein [Pseudomonas panipatensis]SDH48900.1 hypothetical protein SAMN05216272_101768 [Pseudomonas panipatensis]SMP63526.1 hypothetical protein SAMN06295951_10674 [Pseudomonas panipatensis]
MNREAIHQLTRLAMATRLAAHQDAVPVAARMADTAAQMALALEVIDARESSRYFDLITNAMKHRLAELRAAKLASTPWTKEAR